MYTSTLVVTLGQKIIVHFVWVQILEFVKRNVFPSPTLQMQAWVIIGLCLVKCIRMNDWDVQVASTNSWKGKEKLA